MCIGCGQLHACLVNVSVFKHWHGILAVSTAGITLGGLSLRCSMREAHHGRGVAGCYVALVCNYAESHNMLLEFREAHITLVDADFSWSDKKRTGFHRALKNAQTLLAGVKTLRGNILWNGHAPNGDYPVVCFFLRIDDEGHNLTYTCQRLESFYQQCFEHQFPEVQQRLQHQRKAIGGQHFRRGHYHLSIWDVMQRDSGHQICARVTQPLGGPGGWRRIAPDTWMT